MSGAAPPERGWRRLGLTPGALAAIGTIVTVGVAVGLLPPLLSLTLAARGYSERSIGLLIALLAVAALTATPFASRLAARFGTAPTIAALTLVMAVLVPAIRLVEDMRWLAAVIFLYGVASSLCFSLSEYWINAATPEHRRGLVMGLYATLLSIGFAVGPAIIVVAGAETIRPFLIGGGVLALSSLPAIAARHLSPQVPRVARRPFIRLVAAVPLATFGAFIFAMGESGGFAFLPLWGLHLGFGAAVAPLLGSAMTLGNVAFQIPLGLLADRIDRRKVLLGLALAGAGGMAAAWAVAESAAALMAVLFVWGGATAGIYTVGLAHLASRFSAADLAGANAAFVFCYALGMLVGPPIIGDAMARAPTAGLPLSLGIAFGLYAVLAAWRLIRRPAAGP